MSEPAFALGLNLLGVASVGVAVRTVSSQDSPRLTWGGTLGAFVLAAQAINLPLAPGVSAHAIGAGLVTLVVGPALSIVVLTSVLLLQALLLADGGLTVLGINALTIAVLPALAMHTARSAFGSKSSLAPVVGTVAGSLLGAATLSTVLVLGAKSPASWTYGLLLSVQGCAGLVEGLATAAALRALRSRAPQLLEPARHQRTSLDASIAVSPPSRRRSALTFAVAAVGLLLAAMPFASDSPDALETVVQRLSPVAE